jgi:hypothetical protein
MLEEKEIDPTAACVRLAEMFLEEVDGALPSEARCLLVAVLAVQIKYSLVNYFITHSFDSEEKMPAPHPSHAHVAQG